jgi:hypothetical protein
MKKLTASNDSESSKPKQSLDMRSIDVEGANKKPGVGSRFTKIGGAGAAGSRFKKVGVAVSGKEGGYEKDAEMKTEAKTEVGDVKADEETVEVEAKVLAAAPMPGVQLDIKQEADAAMVDVDEEEAITWEEYDFTKPTGCDHASCSGLQTEGIWSGEWVAV